jgi:hypothetical protein
MTRFEPLEPRRLLSTIIGLTADNRLVRFDDGSPETVAELGPVQGLAAGERVVGIDYRPRDGRLYGVIDGAGNDRIVKLLRDGSSSLLYNLSTQLTGTEFGVDVNPVPDALRITSDAGQNLRIPFATGATNADGALTFSANDLNSGATPGVTASAYTNAFPGATATVLHDIDANLDALLIQSPANAGTLVTRGPLGVDAGAQVGFDITPSSSRFNYRGRALVSLSRAADPGSLLYRLDLATGGLTDLGAVGGTGAGAVKLVDIAIVPNRGSSPAGLQRVAEPAAFFSRQRLVRDDANNADADDDDTIAI